MNALAIYCPNQWRGDKKEQFSDGVGYGWIDTLKTIADEKVSDQQLATAEFRFPYNTPTTKEAYMYREIFAELFPLDDAAKCVPGGPSIACSSAAAIEWDASFKKPGRSIWPCRTQCPSRRVLNTRL